MYKFTNGVVVYDDITRDRYIKAGMVLVKEPKPEIKEEKQVGESEINSNAKQNEFRKSNKRTDRFSKNFR